MSTDEKLNILVRHVIELTKRCPVVGIDKTKEIENLEKLLS